MLSSLDRVMVVRVEGGRAKVMTWNIWWRFKPRWRERQPALIETLRKVDPDVHLIVSASFAYCLHERIAAAC